MSTSFNEQEIKTKLRAWVAAKSKHPEAAQLTDETPILERRILSSLQVMDLILHLEQLRGTPLQPDELQPGTFSSVNRIYEYFFQGK